ncbi:unnamed protein product [Adineta ricciae]|uniref:G domain-containing protein n=1 Tax=Adineta ricciae TaxID=249248 RepID=A0A814Z423_ADIRI|nr:unnamed protein product [Adineta ricciae]
MGPLTNHAEQSNRSCTGSAHIHVGQIYPPDQQHLKDQGLCKLVYTSAENLQNNSFKKEIVTKLLHTRTSNIRDSLSKQYYPTEVEHVVDKLQFNVILIGSLRVGKSQLINALCGQGIAEISPGLNSCSKKIKCYTLQDYQQLTSEIKPFQINFFHTPSI